MEAAIGEDCRHRGRSWSYLLGEACLLEVARENQELVNILSILLYVRIYERTHESVESYGHTCPWRPGMRFR